MNFNLRLFGGRGGSSGGGGGGGSSSSGQMGARGGGSSAILPPNPNLNPTTGMRMTKTANEIFEKAYTEARVDVRRLIDHDSDPNMLMISHFDELLNRNSAIFSKNTLNGVQAKINSEHKMIDQRVKLGMMDNERANINRAALNAVQRRLDNTVSFLKDELHLREYGGKKK